MGYQWLFLGALPLNFIGFLLKYKTKISNYLIAFFLSIIGMIGCSFYFYKLNAAPIYYLPRGLVVGFLVSSVATSGWDQMFGLKNFFSDVMAFNKIIHSLSQEVFLMNEKRLASYRRKLLKNLSAIGIYIGIVVLICVFLQKGLTEIIDYTVTMTIGCFGTILLSDILSKAYFEKEKLNVQYGIVFLTSVLSLVSFSIAYFTVDWTVFIISSVVCLILLSLTFFLAHYSYLPSLRTKEESENEAMTRKWLLYKTMTKDEIVEDMLKNILYYFKAKKWGADVDLTKPMFLDSKGVPQSAKAASVSNNSSEPIDSATLYFEEVIATNPSYENISEVR